MARPEKRKARKDYPNEGIKAGDEYWYVKLKLQRGGKVMRNDFGRLFNKSLHRDQPDRLGPAGVAYDDSLGLGEFLIAEAIGGH